MNDFSIIEKMNENINKAILRIRLNKVLDLSKFNHPKFLNFINNLQGLCEVMEAHGYTVDFLKVTDRIVCNIFNKNLSKENPFSIYYDYKDNTAGIIDESINNMGDSAYDDIDLLFNVYTGQFIEILP